MFPPAATLLFTSGTFSLGSTANIAGAGTVILSNSTFNFNSNSVSLAGPISMTGGTLNGPGALTLNAPFSWSGGTIAVNTGAHFGLTLAGARHRLPLQRHPPPMGSPQTAPSAPAAISTSLSNPVPN